MKKVLLAVTVLVVSLSFVGCTNADQERQAKDAQSANDGGLYRTLDVYDYQGHQLRHYEGKFDIDANTDGNGGTSGNKVKFDLDGKRHIIYGGVVITDEK